MTRWRTTCAICWLLILERRYAEWRPAQITLREVEAAGRAMGQQLQIFKVSNERNQPDGSTPSRVRGALTSWAQTPSPRPSWPTVRDSFTRSNGRSFGHTQSDQRP